MSLVTPQVKSWIDGELYIPAHWFKTNNAEKMKNTEILGQMTFKKKPESSWLDQAGIETYGDVPVNIQVYLE